eukprot:TRINITY_DN9515_c0_g1_i17.p1 TRINITY_DN9515_c0_g1~~TRINITY_DN9515_c0_g1_i17.p1  ORF type:complete len:167 (-),score=24.95 TRINITY_DN9515_c0_g1_i17:23-523(-)
MHHSAENAADTHMKEQRLADKAREQYHSHPVDRAHEHLSSAKEKVEKPYHATKNALNRGLDSAKEEGESLLHRAGETAESVRDKGESLLHRAKDRVREKGESLMGHAKDTVESARDKGESLLGRIMEQGRDALEKGEELVKKPYIKEIGRAVQQECRDRSRMPSSA